MSQKSAKAPTQDEKKRTASPAGDKKAVERLTDKASAESDKAKPVANSPADKKETKTRSVSPAGVKKKLVLDVAKNSSEKASNDNEKAKPSANAPADKKELKTRTESPVSDKIKASVTPKPAEKAAPKPAEKAAPKPADKSAPKPSASSATDNKPEVKANKETKKPEEPKPINETQVNKHPPLQQSVTKANGVSDVVLTTNGSSENGLHVVSGGDAEDEEFVIGDNDNDELFPELSYEDGSDNENFEPTTPDLGPLSRSMTRRSQVKPARTPETPRPNKTSELNGEDSKMVEINVIVEPEKHEKLLRLRERHSASPRRLRSDDRITPEANGEAVAGDTTEKAAEEKKSSDEVGAKADPNETSKTIKTDTNYSKSRIKVSPYRKTRMHDNTSLIVNCSDNDSTMDVSMNEGGPSSSAETVQDTHFASTIRGIRGRRSYKTLGEINFTRPKKTEVVMSAGGKVTPVVHVVGRKRTLDGDPPLVESGKRMRLFDRVVSPLAAIIRPRTLVSSTPLHTRHIIDSSTIEAGISEDVEIAQEAALAENLPVTSPIINSEKLETISDLPIAVEEHSGDAKQRCFIM